ncbi:TIGR02452 family protein [Streptomyces sp. NPDC006879]|uniref:TIGR02452 family protein n=1 Tax=Streptomyces sp. NPDC006879 TaxID=3364767 RepID=UPI0036789569
MSSRLRAIAAENAAVVAAGGYRAPSGREVPLASAVAEAVAGTKMFGPAPLALGETPRSAAPMIFEVTAESSTVAARRLAEDGVSVAVLNFASARNPGGGYVRGASAQEEALCRASALYPTLLAAREFYEHHRAERSALYSDRVIDSPGVPVFRDDRGRFLEDPFSVGFLTSPAPNAGVLRRQEPQRTGDIPGALATRSERVLEVAAVHGYQRLVLGAWGCGVFQNDPVEVAAAFHRHLTGPGRFADRFERVVFAVLDRDPSSPARAAFAAAFLG